MSFEYEWQVLSHMPTPVSADEFLRLAEANGVVDKLELEKAMKSLTEQGADFSNASTLANAPVSNQTLTRWQANCSKVAIRDLCWASTGISACSARGRWVRSTWPNIR